MAWVIPVISMVVGAAQQVVGRQQAISDQRKAKKAAQRAAILGEVGDSGQIMDPTLAPTDFSELLYGNGSPFGGSRFSNYGLG